MKAISRKRTTICEIFEHICAATRWINDIRMAQACFSSFETEIVVIHPCSETDRVR